MKTRPPLLYLMAALNCALILGFPIQVFLINEHEWTEIIPVFSELTLLNWFVMGVLAGQIPLILRGSRFLSLTVPFTGILIAFNNWIVSSVGFDYSMTQTAMATMGFTATQTLWFHPTIRILFVNPASRWWMTRVREKMQIPIQIWTTNGMPIVTSVYDISPGGVFVHFSIESLKQCGIKVGDPIRLRLRLGSVYRLTAQAKVVRFAKAQGQYPEGIGLKFVAMSRQDQLILEKFLEKNKDLVQNIAA